MGTLSVDKLMKTSTGAAEFTLPATDGTASQAMITDGAGQLSFATVAGGASITTEGDYFYNYNTITSNLTTTVETTKAAFVAGPITIADGFTWTISGELTML
jgi:hypothetical protein